MINAIGEAKNKDLMVEDYVSLFWLGQINELIVDKTGCLTKSEMRVALVYSE
jgi:cation transport ATPase